MFEILTVLFLAVCGFSTFLTQRHHVVQHSIWRTPQLDKFGVSAVIMTKWFVFRLFLYQKTKVKTSNKIILILIL